MTLLWLVYDAPVRILVTGLVSLLAAASLAAKPAGGRPVTEHAVAGHSGGRRHVATIEAVRRLLHGIPQRGNTLGYSNAPVTLQVFGDLECPICRELALGALDQLIRGPVRARRLRIQYRSLETATRERSTFIEQQVAALAAGQQDKMWYYVELFYREQGEEDSGYVTNSYLRGIARQVLGLNIGAWEAARGDPLLATELAEDEQTSNAEGFTGTPSFLIGKSGQHMKKLENPNLEEAASFEAAIDRLLGKKGR
jgi:protein-disulfide isomerase